MVNSVGNASNANVILEHHIERLGARSTREKVRALSDAKIKEFAKREDVVNFRTKMEIQKGLLKRKYVLYASFDQKVAPKADKKA